MDITPQVPIGRTIIEGYGAGGFMIDGHRVAGSLLVFADRVVDWPVTAFDQVTLENLADVTAAVPAVEILLIGSGARMLLAPAALRAALRDAGVALDVMDTGAACRTYNVLLAEERRVAAALIAVD
jgi:uncharacterized protein